MLFPLKRGKRATYSLEDLFPSNIVQPSVQILDSRCDILDLGLVAALNLVGLANNHVQGQLNATVGTLGRQP